MVLARVLGPVVATIKHPAFAGHTLLLCQPIDERGRDVGTDFIAVDHAQAGKGDTVLALREGNSARQALRQKMAPIRSFIAAVVDHVDVEKP